MWDVQSNQNLPAHTVHVTVQSDFKDAFNSLCRPSMLRTVCKRAPGLAKVAASIYSKHSELLVRGAAARSLHIQSQTGVRQGDPAGSRYFGPILQDVLETHCRNSSRSYV